MTKRIAITPGEPAGIGPDLTIKLAQQSWSDELVVIASKTLMEERAKQLNVPLTLIDYDVDAEPKPQAANTLTILNIDLAGPCVAGALNVENGHYVVDTLRIASEKNMSGEFDAVVTGPVNKSLINRAGIAFSGHTEYFAHQANCSDVVMMLATTGLRVALVTTHIPLAYVSKAITAERLTKVTQILHDDLKNKFGLADPKIFVCGLNPHAGEGGHLGREEIEVIEPTLESLRANGINLTGPLYLQTRFSKKNIYQRLMQSSLCITTKAYQY